MVAGRSPSISTLEVSASNVPVAHSVELLSTCESLWSDTDLKRGCAGPAESSTEDTTLEFGSISTRNVPTADAAVPPTIDSGVRLDAWLDEKFDGAGWPF
mmetsp:Transcript_2995/g.9076  ORF Transcript_2995/g.9076 Transcript_2995/m.9076 type:complete len:100 (-) Transcript_2995:5036-5335(-)